MISQRSFAAEEGWHEAASALMIVPQVLVRAKTCNKLRRGEAAAALITAADTIQTLHCSLLGRNAYSSAATEGAKSAEFLNTVLSYYKYPFSVV